MGENGSIKEEWRYGFRNLEIFNLALLAKQGWRFLKDRTSLEAQFFREKY